MLMFFPKELGPMNAMEYPQFGVDYVQKAMGESDSRFKFTLPYKCINNRSGTSYTSVICCNDVLVADAVLDRYRSWTVNQDMLYVFIDSDEMRDMEKAYFNSMWTD